ncbi:MAG: hypothetical protein Kow0022_03350 [Phycisphaerales bacterium]
MQSRIRFGFLLGLLVGTASVGGVSVMMGQAEAQAGQADTPRYASHQVTQSPDGRYAYLWGVDAKHGKLHLLERVPVTEQRWALDEGGADALGPAVDRPESGPGSSEPDRANTGP